MMIVYYACYLIAIACIFVGNNEGWVRKFNIKFGFAPTSNVFKDTQGYWVLITILFGIAYLRGLIV